MKWLATITFIGVILGLAGTLIATYRQEVEKLKANGETLQLKKWLVQHPVTLGLLGTFIAGAVGLITTFKQENEKAIEKIQTAAKEKQNAEAIAKFEREQRIGTVAQLELQGRLTEKTEELVESQKVLRQKSEGIAKLYRSIAESQQELKVKSDETSKLNREIAEAQRDLRLKSEEIAKLNKEIATSQQDLKSAVTGGDSFCYARPDNITTPNPILVIEHFGNYAVQDVYVKLLDEDLADKLLKDGLGMVAAVDKSSLDRNVGNITPFQKLFLTNSVSVNEQSRRYGFWFYGKNGVWHQ